jgi:hypothetical protein
VVRDSTDYYERSVIWSDFQALSAIARFRPWDLPFRLGPSPFNIQVDTLGLGAPFKPFSRYPGCVLCVGTEMCNGLIPVQRRVGVTIFPTRPRLIRLVLGFRQSSFHRVELALRDTQT